MTVYDDRHSQYITHTFAREDEALAQVRERIPRRGLPAITVKPEEGRFLQFLAAACGARQAVEIGTLGGYSGTWLARGLAAGGRLITLEREPAYAEVAREHFELTGVADRVEILVGDAHGTLRTLDGRGPFDLVFIDAEKSGYPDYLDWSLANIRAGGVIAAHNAFSQGRLVGHEAHDTDLDGLRAFSQRLASDPRLISTIFPAGDGMAVAVVR